MDTKSVGFRVTDVLQLQPQQLDRTLLLGLPGIGKSEIVLQYAKQQAKRENRQFVNLKELSQIELKEVYNNPEKYYVYYRIIATHVFPEDVSIPRENNEYLVFKSPLILSILARRDISGLLFIDELTNVQRTDQRVLFYSLLQERELGWNLRLSDNITLIAAGNPPEVSSDASTLPAPLANRLTIIEVEAPTLEEWARYMERYDYDRRVLAYLDFSPRDFIRIPENTETLENFPTPRSWTNLALKISPKTPKSLLNALVVGHVGREVGARFLAFINTKTPTLEEFLANPTQIWSNAQTQAKYLLTYSVAQNIEKISKKKKFSKLINDVYANEREFFVLLFRLMPKELRLKMATHPVIASLLDKLTDELKDFFF